MRLSSIVTMCIVAAGCGADDAATPTVTVTDSAGVRIVSHDLRDVGVPPWRALGDPELEIGVQDGPSEYTFSGITDLTVAPDGRILVSDRIAQEIRVYDASGSWERTLGGQGEGPGEFSSAPRFAGVARDTVYAFDGRARRVTPYHLDGGHGPTVSMVSTHVERPLIVLRRADGSYMLQSYWIPAESVESQQPRLDHDSVAITAAGSDGAWTDSLTRLADFSRARLVRPRPDGTVSVVQANTPYSARAFLLVDGAAVTLAHSSAFDFTTYAPNGTLAAKLRVSGVQHPATQADIRRRQEDQLREELGEDVPESARLLNVEFAPEKLQAFVAALYSETGDLWVALQDFDELDGTRWLVFASDGSLRGSVHTPETFALRYITDEYIVGFVMDEFDVPYIRRYSLSAPTP